MNPSDGRPKNLPEEIALSGAAFSLHGTDRVEIHCDQVNRASAAVPQRLGYQFDRIQDHEPDSPAESGKRMIWIMTREAFGGSEAERRARDARVGG